MKKRAAERYLWAVMAVLLLCHDVTGAALNERYHKMARLYARKADPLYRSYYTQRSIHGTGERTLPSGSGTVPSGSGTVPNASGTVPSGSGTVPSGSGTVPSGSGTVPSGSGTVPSGSGTVPSGSSLSSTEAGSKEDEDFMQQAEISEVSRELTAANECFPWQQLHGSECVCATEDRCESTGGHVCDDDGNQYRSRCSFQQAMCSGQISTLRHMGVCDNCEYLRLQGGSILPEDKDTGLGIFRRVIDGDVGQGQTPEYEAIDGSGFRVMMVHEWENWVVGKRNASGEFVALKAYMAGGIKNPQYIGHGFFVLAERDGQMVWDIDPFLHFECISEHDIPNIQERFFFVAFIVAAVVATAVSTTLSIVQSARGCLYFPEVCDLRDEIEDVLKPRVEQKRSNFESNYGDAEVYKSNAVDCYTKTRTIRQDLVDIQALHERLGYLNNQAFQALKNVPSELLSADFAYSLESYKEYQEGVGKAAALSLLGLEIEIGLAIYSLSATTVTTAMVAFAAIGAAVAIFMAVVDIINSIEQEREIRDQLRRNKQEILNGEADLDRATNGMLQFQREICKELIVPLSKLALEGSKYSQDFTNFLRHLENHYIFVTDPNVCNEQRVYSQLKGTFMTSLKTQLTTISNHIKNDKADIQAKVQLAEEMATFAQAIRDDVLVRKKRPSEILTYALQNRPRALVSNLFNNEYELLKFIATNIAPDCACYWGVSLAPFRSGAATVNNYMRSSVVAPCASPEVTSQTSAIANSVSSRYPPCRIINNLDRTVVRDVSGLIRYIATHVLPNEQCYWGYPLSAIRSNTIGDDELNAAVMMPTFFTMLSMQYPSPSSGQLSTARTTVCSTLKICYSDAWINFILCMTNSAWGSVISCSGVPNVDGCRVDMAAYSC